MVQRWNIWLPVALGIGSLTISILLLLVIHYTIRATEWCSDLNPKQCDYYALDDMCYCIKLDQDRIASKEIGIFEHAKIECEADGGSLPTLESEDLTIWLSKRMNYKAIDNAVIGLQKIDSVWMWVSPECSDPAHNIVWRPSFPTDDQHVHAMLSVEATVGNIEDQYYFYGYKLYNYEYYLNKDEAYQWYGFITNDNVNSRNYLDEVYYICSYGKKKALERNETSSPVELQFKEECSCNENEYVKLSELEEQQIISSPGYPNRYCTDMECKWTFVAHSGLTVRLEWMSFNTEDQMDLVSIHDGPTTDSPILEKCSGTKCHDQTSSSNQLHIDFNSDHVTTDIGFKAKVTAVPNDICYCTSQSLKIRLDTIGDSYSLSSPNYPMPYCTNQKCGWQISTKEDYALHVIWRDFDLESTDYVNVHGQYSSLGSCTNNVCQLSTSINSNEIQIEFITDSHPSDNQGFSAIVAVIPGYCEKNKLTAHFGSVTYSETLEEDRHVPIEATATLSCPEHFKLAGTFNDSTESVYCEAMGWSKDFSPCVQVCDLKSDIGFEDLSDMPICELSDVTDALSVATGHSIEIKHYDKITITKSPKVLSSHETICVEGVWSPKKPICQLKQGIMIFGGHTSSDPFNQIVELFSPIENKVDKIEFSLDSHYTRQVGALLSDMRIILAGGSTSSIENFQVGTTIHSDSTFVDLKTKQASPGPPMITGRTLAGSALIKDEFFVCGGIATEKDFVRGTKTCEVFKQGRWHQLPSMRYDRNAFAMVAVEQTLFAIGGDVDYLEKSQTMNLAHPTNRVEKLILSSGQSWQSVASMKYGRSNLAATQFNGQIFACGGLSTRDYLPVDVCERFHPHYDVWHTLPPMNKPHYGFFMTSIYGQLYVFGGDASKSEMFSVPATVEHYDMRKSTWISVQGLTTSARIDGLAILVPVK